MEIIALRGIADTGKSTTIRILHHLLLQNGYKLVSSTLNQQGGDFRSIFSKKDKFIGVTSSGDNYDLVHDNLEALINSDCKICVCACRTYDRSGHGTNAAIDNFINFQKQYINKIIANSESQEESVNRNDARKLFDAVDAIINV